ncbi:MAG TPA: hypothetical protein VGB00_16690 [Pyrinomonadaceae bacterium]
MADFIVRIDGLKLSKEAEASISREIQAAVLRQVATIDTGGDFSARIPDKQRIPDKLRWRGIYLRNKAFEENISLNINEQQF